LRGLAILIAGECVLCGLLAEELAGRLNPFEPTPRLALAVSAIACLVAAALAPAVRRLQKERPDRHSVADAAPRLWTATAAMAVVAQMAGVACAARPDWDDTWYLSAVQRYTEGGELNREGFSLPGEDVVPPHTRLLAWELMGATLCRLSGVPPLVSHHTLLPPFLILLALAVHWRLFSKHLLSRRLAPLAMLGLSGYWLFGVSSYDSPGSYALTRTWQGKSVLWVLGIPLTVNAMWTFLKDPRPLTWLPCLLASAGALAMSSSAVFLIPVCVPSFCAAMALFGGLAVTWRAWIAAGVVAAPQVVYGLCIRSGMGSYGALTERTEGVSWLQSVSWGGIDYGSAELLWALLLPTAAGLLVSRQARAYLVWLPCLAAATSLNPLAYEWVASHLTSYHTYNRLLWLLPIGAGLGAAVALASDAVLAPWSSDRSATRLLLVIGMVAAVACLPGRFVWSEKNEGPYPGLCFTWGENALKIPGDLLPIVRRVAEDERLHEGRLLLPEHLTQFFAPYSSRIRYVSSRPTYTVEALTALKRPDEGAERVELVLRLLGSTGTEYLVHGLGGPGQSPASRSTVLELLGKYSVSGIVVDIGAPTLERRLRQYGFRQALRGGRYSLWVAIEPRPCQLNQVSPSAR